MNARGDRVVAWYRRGHVEARVRRRGGSWGSVLDVAASRHTPSVLRAAIDGDGRVLLAWATIDQGEDRASLLTFDAAVRPRRRGWTHRRLDRYRASGAPFSGAQQQIHAAFDSAGRGMVAWPSRAGEGPAFVMTRLGAQDRFTAPEPVAPLGEPVHPSDLAVGPHGRVAAVWWLPTDSGSPASVVRVATRNAGAPFAAPETLPVTCTASFLCAPSDGRAAFDGVTGRLTIAWLQRDDADYRVWVATRETP